jgi:hypothetical protein
MRRGRSILSWSVLGSLLVGLAGCVSRDDDPNLVNNNEEVEGVEDQEGGTVLKAAYAILFHSKVTAKSRSDGTTASAETRLLGAVTVQQELASADFAIQPCQLQLPEISGKQPRLSDAFLQSTPAVRLKATLKGPKVTTDKGALVLGVHLADPLTSPVPQEASDRGVYDQDGDGNPGISVTLGEGTFSANIWVGLRVVAALVGTVGRGGYLTGDASITADLGVYGSRIPFVDVHQKYLDAQRDTQIVARSDTFKMIPIRSASCERVLRVDWDAPPPPDTTPNPMAPVDMQRPAPAAPGSTDMAPSPPADLPDDDVPDPGGECHSDTLGMNVPAGVCVQSKFRTHKWYECHADGLWYTQAQGPGPQCTMQYPLP